eukprot:RCo043696
MSAATTEIVPAAEVPKDASPFFVDLKYPGHWLAHPELHPASTAMQAEVLRRLEAFGCVDTPELKHIFQNLDIAGYAGFSHPSYSYDHLLVYAVGLTTWIGWDDEQVETLGKSITDCSPESISAACQQLEPVLRALEGLDRVEQRKCKWSRAWGWVGDEYERLGASPAFRATAAKSMRQWVLEAVQEAARQKWGREEVAKLPWSFFWGQRIVTIGMPLTCILLERSVGIELPERLRDTPEYRTMVECSAALVLIANELVSWPKEELNGWQNLLAVHRMLGMSRTRRDTMEAMMRYHDEAVRQYDEAAQRLLASELVVGGNWQQLLGLWAQALRHCASG